MRQFSCQLGKGIYIPPLSTEYSSVEVTLLSPVDALKAFFSTPDKPVISKELLAFRRGDPDGYHEIKNLVVAHYESLGEVVEDAVKAS